MTKIQQVATLFLISFLQGCSLEIGVERGNDKGEGDSSSLSGTWYGTRTVVIDNVFDHFQARQDGSYELYMVIRENTEGSIRLPNCFGGYEDVPVSGQSFSFRNKQYTVQSDRALSGKHLRDESYSGERYYTSVVEEWVKVSDSTGPIGRLIADWDDFDPVNAQTALYCAEIGSFHFTSSNGDNVVQTDAAVSDGDDFSWWQVKTGTDARRYLQVAYEEREIFGFHDLGKRDMAISFDRKAREGGVVQFSATDDQTGNGISGEVHINPI